MTVRLLVVIAAIVLTLHGPIPLMETAVYLKLTGEAGLPYKTGSATRAKRPAPCQTSREGSHVA